MAPRSLRDKCVQFWTWDILSANLTNKWPIYGTDIAVSNLIRDVNVMHGGFMATSLVIQIMGQVFGFHGTKFPWWQRQLSTSIELQNDTYGPIADQCLINVDRESSLHRTSVDVMKFWWYTCVIIVFEALLFAWKISRHMIDEQQRNKNMPNEWYAGHIISSRVIVIVYAVWIYVTGYYQLW